MTRQTQEWLTVLLLHTCLFIDIAYSCHVCSRYTEKIFAVFAVIDLFFFIPIPCLLTTQSTVPSQHKIILF